MPKIKKAYVTWEEFNAIQGGGWTPSAHTHVKVDITDWGDWIDQAVKQASSPTFVTAKLTALTDGYVPYHVSDAAGLANSPIFTDGTKVGIGTDSPTELGQIRKVFDSSASNQLFNALDILGYDVSAMWGGVGCGITFSLRDNAQAEVKLGAIYVRDEGGGLATADGGLSFHTALAGTLAERVRIRKDGNVGIGKVPTCKLDVNGTIKATTFEGNLHWDYITNEPTYYPPEYHYHVGKDIVSLHLVDLDDVEAGDIFDVLPTAAIHGEGNYDWWGTWTTTAPANTSAAVVVLAGDDKMLQLVDNNNAGFVKTELSTDAGHPIVTGVVQFQMRVTVAVKQAYFELDKDAVSNMYIYFGQVPQTIRFHGGVAEENCGAWVANTWYTIRIHFDCVARAAVVFVDNVFIARIALSDAAAGDYVSTLRVRTEFASTGYNVEVNKLKVFNLTI